MTAAAFSLLRESQTDWIRLR